MSSYLWHCALRCNPRPLEASDADNMQNGMWFQPLTTYLNYEWNATPADKSRTILQEPEIHALKYTSPTPQKKLKTK